MHTRPGGAERACVRPRRAGAPQPPPAATRRGGRERAPRFPLVAGVRPLPPGAAPPGRAVAPAPQAGPQRVAAGRALRARRKCLPQAGGRFPEDLSSEGRLPVRLPPARRGLPSPAPSRAARSGAGTSECQLLGGAFPAESGKLGQVLRELYKGARRASEKGRLLRRAAAGERCERGTGNLRAEERREETTRGLSVHSGRRDAMRGHQEGTMLAFFV
ncbi:uncharacterized protein LOC128147629 [Harpia harpyja]|uniref:uncharacterized protein LOC128147629 n=1 Tax=Harpia harpyja TaxID=202280 RepID=UPI0022B0F363|nr:uncharacterized protein LOC128147629 [Harpia harpyja]